MYQYIVLYSLQKENPRSPVKNNNEKNIMVFTHSSSLYILYKLNDKIM